MVENRDEFDAVVANHQMFLAKILISFGQLKNENTVYILMVLEILMC
jgi:hypothetical protein